MAVAEKPLEINLATESGRDKLKNLPDRDGFYEKCDPMNFLKTLEKPPLRFDQMSIFVADDLTVLNKNRVLYALCGEPHSQSDLHMKNAAGDVASGVIISDCEKRLKNNKNCRVLVLINADDADTASEFIHPENSIVNCFGESEMPSVSFGCLTQFWGDSSSAAEYEKTVQRLAKGDLKLLDYTADERIDLSEADKKAIKKSKGGPLKLKPPKPGFTLVGNNNWHRPGSCLFHDTKKDRYLIVGQDDDAYFGCELPAKASTVAEAFDLLMPDAVRGKPFLRQGEWFALQVDEKDVPKTLDCAVQFDGNSSFEENVFLPLETPDSNKHLLNGGEGRVGKDGKLYVKDVNVAHDEHGTMVLQGWWTFHRNTALRSVSQKGVD